MGQVTKLQARVVAKLKEDSGFRDRLRSDPKGAIARELGVAMPASLTLEVHEDSATTAHLILPRAEALSESELQAVAGGSDFEEINHSYTLPPPPPPTIGTVDSIT